MNTNMNPQMNIPVRTALRRTLRTLICRAVVCAAAALAWSQPSFADDTTNAALISDATVWAQSMHQVMGGSSAAFPGAGTIRGPAGVYAVVLLDGKITDANAAATPSLTADQALTNYFSFLLQNPATSGGLLVIAKWKDLERKEGSYEWHWLNDAVAAITAWNAANPGAPAKTLQLVIAPGFNSPPWLFDELTSCDGLFLSSTDGGSPPSVSPSCGYTTIFQETESGTPSYMKLPLPWNPTYKSKWQAFLTALNGQIGPVSTFVSIAVAGPTASSAEIILPNASKNNNSGTLTLPSIAVPTGYTAVGTDVLTAWNALLANNYGATSPYLNSDRAFVEEWAAAIDMFGQTFSGITLTLATGRGLPEFPAAAGSPLLAPPPAFAPDCGTAPTMDCSAEAAILAYFAGPGIGGANAKATQQNGLRAFGGNALSGASVKWLSQSTSAGVSVLPGSPAIVSRMLGGLQFGKSFSLQPSYQGCPTVTGTCTPIPTPEQALLNTLATFFAGTSFGYDYGTATATNGSVTVANAPINYLQVYDDDFLYAAGLAGCSTADLMAQSALTAGTLTCQVGMTATAVHDSKSMTAQDLLNLASHQLASTVEAVSVPPPSCPAGTVLRGAFPGDPVCVSLTSHLWTYDDNAATAIDYATSYTVTTIVPNIPYGICKIPLQYRQAYMGDYVCVSAQHACQAAADNARSAGLTPPTCAPPPVPRPTCSGSSCI
jgi:hypothetical protein